MTLETTGLRGTVLASALRLVGVAALAFGCLMVVGMFASSTARSTQLLAHDGASCPGVLFIDARGWASR